jgi:hypothetical protein
MDLAFCSSTGSAWGNYGGRFLTTSTAFAYPTDAFTSQDHCAFLPLRSRIIVVGCAQQHMDNPYLEENPVNG